MDSCLYQYATQRRVGGEAGAVAAFCRFALQARSERASRSPHSRGRNSVHSLFSHTATRSCATSLVRMPITLSISPIVCFFLSNLGYFNFYNTVHDNEVIVVNTLTLLCI